MQLSRERFERLAIYFADISKALFVGTLITQALPGVSNIERVVRGISQAVLALLFLYFSLLFTKDKE